MTIFPAKSGFAYRLGRFTIRTFTPRPTVDTTAKPGKLPGLSLFETVTLGRKDRAQLIDLSLLQWPLAAIADDVAAGGTAGHVAITPVDAKGNVAQRLLEEWASYRIAGRRHAFTQIVMDAVVSQNLKG